MGVTMRGMIPPTRKPKIVVICGPTGVGKTSLAIRMAQHFDGEIVGADSMQLYRHMDIATAKPTAQEQAAIPHHLIDVVNPDEEFDAVRYADMAHRIVLELLGRGKRAFVVGGTGLYIKALINGLFAAPPTDPEIRKDLAAEAEKLGNWALFERLQRIDPESAAKIHHHDTYRIIRALETFANTGTTISEYHRRHQSRSPRFDALKIGLRRDRHQLYERIDERVEVMLAQGLQAEVQGLLDKGYSLQRKAMQSLGYRHMGAYLNGEMPREEAIRTMKRDHRRYAKRQLTWFKADETINWIEPHEFARATALIKNFYDQIDRNS